ncbi:MAG: dihydrolipoamide acetyltransferase family protein [Arenicella sp.]
MEHTVLVPALNESDDNGQGTVVGIMVEIGDTLCVGDPVLEIETDKVTVEIPSTYAGIVTAIHTAIGDEVTQGIECLTLRCTKSKLDDAPESIDLIETSDVKNEEQSVIKASVTLSKDDGLHEPQVSVQPETEQQWVSSKDNIYDSIEEGAKVPAGPSSRRLARELGIDISALSSQQYGSRISKNDIKAFAKSIIKANQTSGVLMPSVTLAEGCTNPVQFSSRAIPDVSEFGDTRVEKISGIAKTTSANMNQAWTTIPHAWLQEKVDITELEKWRQVQKNNDTKLTLTVIIVKAIAVALKQFPRMNSSFDEQADAIVYKDYIDIGIAVDTPHGLLVPNLRKVDQKCLVQLSNDIRDLSGKAKGRKLLPADLQGAGITLSNLGGIGLSSIFPIVNWPQVAIVGVAASEKVPKLIQGELVERQMVTLTLGFDHRIINGAEGARFLVYIKELLEDIRRLLI